MPPVGQPSATQSELASFFEWATCGAMAPPEMIGGFEVSREIYQTPSNLPSEAQTIEWKVNGGISGNDRDMYRCFGFKGPGNGEDIQIIQFEIDLDQAQVVHHIVLYENSMPVAMDGDETSCGVGLNTAVFAWAPGQGSLGFDGMGLISNASKNYVMEIHYNKPEGSPDVEDHSGVKISYMQNLPKQLDMMTLGPENFSIPSGQRTVVEGKCVIEEQLEIIASMPHMHNVGRKLQSTIKRVDGTEEDLITLDRWDFNFQLYYATPNVILYPGDEVKTTCIYENQSQRDVNFGPLTKDEMCYNFIYVSPPPAKRRCNTSVIEPLAYVPGACAPMVDENAYPPEIRGSYQEGTPPMATGGDVPSGIWHLENVEIWFNDFQLGFITVDGANSFYRSVGILELDTMQNQLKLDIQSKTHLASSQGAGFDRDINLTASGEILNLDSATGSFVFHVQCPEERQSPLTYSYENGKLVLFFPFNNPVPGIQVLYFTLP
jgi:hypothetical protein